MSLKRIVAGRMANGRIGVIAEDVPPLKAGAVLVQVHNSLISPGTELGGWHGYRKRLDEPATSDAPRRFGYSNAGVVLEVGDGVTDLCPGDRVACIGGGYAQHSDYAVVPHRLCAPLPDGVTFAQGSYCMLVATALHGLRRLEPALGEYVAVAGLGIVGQLFAQLLRQAGAYVIGWDTIAFRCDVARSWGIHEALTVAQGTDEAAKTLAFTSGAGLDAAVLAFGGDANRAVETIEKCMKRSPDGHPMGRIVAVGGARFEYKSTLTNIDIRRASRTGPGYHDERWEYGDDYPPVFVRWSTAANLRLVLRLISEGRLNVDCLTTHTIPLKDAEKGIADIIARPEKILGVLFSMHPI